MYVRAYVYCLYNASMYNVVCVEHNMWSVYMYCMCVCTLGQQFEA